MFSFVHARVRVDVLLRTLALHVYNVASLMLHAASRRVASHLRRRVKRGREARVAIIIPSDDYTRNHGCTNYPGHDGSLPYGRHVPEQYLVISIKGTDGEIVTPTRNNN